jgi:L-lactate utilization protein LutC
MFGSQAFGNLAQASTLCGACREACPVGIDLPRMLLEVRAGKAQLTSYPKPAGVSPGLSLGLKVFSWIASSAGRFHFAQRMAALASGLFSSSSGWMRLPPFTGWGAAKDFPQPARQTFRQRMRYHQPLQSSSLEKQAKVVPDQPAVEESSSPRLLPWVDEVEMLEHFAKELAALGAEVIRCELDGLAEKIAALVRETGQEQVWAWDEGYFPEGLLTGLQSQGLAICKERDPEIKVGLTGALAAVAETGSVVLAGGVGRPLLASLLPEIHIVILRTGQLVQTLEAALQMEALKESQASVLVSGPSRTGDIELTLTVGVHGPKRFVIFWLP